MVNIIIIVLNSLLLYFEHHPTLRKSIEQDIIITVKSCDDIINNALLRVRILDGWIIVSHKVRLNTDNIHHQTLFT